MCTAVLTVYRPALYRLAQVILWDWRKRLATRIFAGHFNSVACCDLAQSVGPPGGLLTFCF